jgi:hypothetical protein
MEVKEINRGAPDPNLFRAPEGYTVKKQQPQQLGGRQVLIYPK